MRALAFFLLRFALVGEIVRFMATKKSTSLTFRMSDDVREALALVAAREDRTMSMQVERFIKSGLVEYGEQNPRFRESHQDLFDSIVAKCA